MPAQMLVLVVGALASALVLGAVALVQSGTNRRLRARVGAAGGAGPAAAGGPSLELPSIRTAVPGERPLLRRLMRVVRYHPDVPQAHTLHWGVVALVAAAVGGAGALRMMVLVGALPALALGAVSALLLARAVFGWQFNRYRKAVFQQIPDAPGLMIRTVRAGLPMSEALRSVSREMPSPSREEYARVVGDLSIGRPLDLSLLRLSERTQLTEYAFLAVTLGLQQQTGGGLAETLENLADTVRKRVALAKRATALAAEARMQAGILAVLPFIAALAMSVIQPFYVEMFTEHPTGRKMAVVGIA